MPGPVAGAENSVMEEPWSLGSGESLDKVLRVNVSGAFPPPESLGSSPSLDLGSSP